MFKVEHDPDIPTKEDYGNTGRLSPDEARRFIEDLCQHMQHRAWEIAQEPDTEIEHSGPSDDGPSATKQLYGDTWTFLYGISSGMRLMSQAHEEEFDWDSGEKIDHGISGDRKWQEHYEQYGYGKYGKGLKIGKRLAFHEDRDFSFSNESQTDSTESSESKFTFNDYGD